jgi:hypothetical protein
MTLHEHVEPGMRERYRALRTCLPGQNQAHTLMVGDGTSVGHSSDQPVGLMSARVDPFGAARSRQEDSRY